MTNARLHCLLLELSVNLVLWWTAISNSQYPVLSPTKNTVDLSISMSIYLFDSKGYRRSMPPQCYVSFHQNLPVRKYFHTRKFKKFFHVEFIVNIGRYLLEGREIQSQHFQQVGWKQLSQHSQQSQMMPPHLIYIIYHLDPGFLLVFETV